jgi:hypothetical protein
MPRQATTTKPVKTWEPPAKSIAAGLKALKSYLASTDTVRRQLRAAADTRNVKMSEVVAQQLADAGVNVEKIGAAGLANLAQSRREMDAYLRKARTFKPAAAKSVHAITLVPFGRAPFNALSVTRTPPFDIADASFNPPDIRPAFGFVNSNKNNGGMSYFLSSAVAVPSDIVGTCLMGIQLIPVWGPIISPFFGFASVQMNASVSMIGSASSAFSGYGHSEGSIGWIVMELDTNGVFTRVVEQTYAEQYYIDVTFGQNIVGPPVTNPAFSSQTSFVTNPERFYQVYVWFWGNIHASGNNPIWGSHAAGSGSIAIESINWTWNPSIFP